MIKRKVCTLTHLRDLLIDKKLQIVVMFCLQVFPKVFNCVLQLFIRFFTIADLIAEEFTFLGEFFLCSQLSTQSIVQKSDHKISYALKVVNEHGIAQLFLHVLVTAFFRVVLVLKTLHSRMFAVLRTAERLNNDLIESLQMVLDSFILLFFII